VRFCSLALFPPVSFLRDEVDQYLAVASGKSPLLLIGGIDGVEAYARGFDSISVLAQFRKRRTNSNV
jgi:hypothetical protein